MGGGTAEGGLYLPIRLFGVSESKKWLKKAKKDLRDIRLTNRWLSVTFQSVFQNPVTFYIPFLLI